MRRRRPGAWGGAYPQYDNRTVLEAVLWIARTGSPGRDLPAEFGRWDTIYRRCHRRCQDGVFSGGRFEGLTANLEPEWDTVMVAGTFVKVHQHGAGASKADARTTLDGRRAALAIGHWRQCQSRGIAHQDCGAGGSSGAMAGLTRALGSSHELITDQAYDTNVALALLAKRNIAAVIRYRPVGTGRRRTGLTLACTECVIW